jgi:hypothetical protein
MTDKSDATLKKAGIEGDSIAAEFGVEIFRVHPEYMVAERIVGLEALIQILKTVGQVEAATDPTIPPYENPGLHLHR